MTDYAAVEYLNLTLAHALYLDAKIDSSDAFIQDEYFWPIDDEIAQIEKLIGIQ